jgi:hypothetical protein
MVSVDLEFTFLSDTIQQVGDKERYIEDIDIIVWSRNAKEGMPESQVLGYNRSKYNSSFL